MKVIAPADMAIAVSAAGLIIDARLFGEKRDGFFAPVDMVTPGYDEAAKKIRLEAAGFISGLKVRAG
jgi:predicted membrane protein